jgi:hypothetical protein
MDVLHVHDLTRLTDQRGGTRISMFLPISHRGSQPGRHRVRLTKLLRQARDALLGDGMRVGQVDSLLGPAHQLLDLRSLWNQPGHGLALFLGPDEFRHFRLPVKLPEMVTMGDRFLIRPLLPLLTAAGHFYVMALTREEIRLFHCTRAALGEMTLDGLPLAVWLTMPRRRPRLHALPADLGEAGSVGFDGADNDGKPLVLQHFQRVDQALRELLADQQAPLVLAGPRHLQRLYHQANTYPDLVPAGVDGSPRDLNPDQLHHRAWPLAEPVLRRHQTAAASAYRTLKGTGRTSTDPAEIIAAAPQGRVEILFLPTTAAQRRPSREAGGPLIRLGDAPGRREQLDLAAVATLRHAGRVYDAPAGRLPDTDPVAAILRY